MIMIMSIMIIITKLLSEFFYEADMKSFATYTVYWTQLKTVK